MKCIRDFDPAPFVVGLLVAVAWAVAHLFIQVPRGWPFFGPGEWDVLLVAQAIVDGAPPHAMVAALHGHELGVYVVAVPVALFRALGFEMVLAAKLAAMCFGASTVGLAAGLASATLRGIHGRGGWLAGVLVGSMLVISWPDWHAVATHLDGSTRHTVLPQLGAVAFMLASWRHDRLGWSAAAGAAVGVAWFINAVSLWTLFLIVGLSLLMLRKHGTARGLRHLAAVAGGIAGWALLYALVVPGGFAGVRAFLMSHPSWIGPILSGAEEAPRPGVAPVGPMELSRHVSSALIGMGGAVPSRAIGALSGLLGWALVLFALLRSGYALIRRRLDGLDLLALSAASWLLPLSYLPEMYRFYAPAYRFWAVPLCLGAVALAVQAELLFAQAQRRRGLHLVLPLLLVIPALISLPRLQETVDFPDSSLAAGMVHAGMHRMGRRPIGIHTTYWALRPHAPAAGRAALDQGYGLQLGFEVAEDLGPEWEADDGWIQLAEVFESEIRMQILLGVGCGLGSSLPTGTSPGPVVALFSGPDRARLLSGLVRCALRQEAEGAAGDRSELIDGLALESSDWQAVSKTLVTGGATPNQRGSWIPESVLVEAPQEGLGAQEDLLAEALGAFPVRPPP